MAGTDCGCETHEGPHWRHLDVLWRERNRQFLERARHRRASGLLTLAEAWAHHLALLAFVQEEQQRLREKGEVIEREEVRGGAVARCGNSIGGAVSRVRPSDGSASQP